MIIFTLEMQSYGSVFARGGEEGGEGGGEAEHHRALQCDKHIFGGVGAFLHDYTCM